MTELDVITAALAAGTAAGFSQTASRAVQDAVAAFRRAVARLVTSAGTDSQLLELDEHYPDDWAARVRQLLSECGADHDPDMLAAARRVLDELEVASPAVGKYVVKVRDVRGVQIGDYTTQNNTFR